MSDGFTIKVNTWNAYQCLRIMAMENKHLASTDNKGDKAKTLNKIYENTMEMLTLIDYMNEHHSDIARVMLEERMREKVTKEGMECSIL